jgi:N-acetylglucosamine-6-phosphate deacetylase
MFMIIKNAMVYTEDGSFVKKDLTLEGEYIVSNEDTSDHGEVLEAEGLYLIPGLTDLHFHGCVGYDFCDGTQQAINAMAEYQASNGITTIAPATMTLDDERLTQIFKNASEYHSESGAILTGIKMEGPYLSLAKKGAQNPKYLRHPDPEHFRRMQALSGGLIKILAIAPEEEGALECIEELKDEVVISLAHTTADYDLSLKAFQKGASHLTHLYNAMPAFSHRSPGVIGAAFDSEHVHVELICDGVHVDPSVVRATFKMFGEDRIILISDSMMATGLKDGQYSLGGQEVTVVGNKATLADGTIAGSATNLMQCMRIAVSFGIPLTTAIKCAAVNPAKEIGIYDKYGSITPGKYANLVLLDQKLEIVKVFLKGAMIDC